MHELKPWLDRRGRYYLIKLSKNGVQYHKIVHRLVAETFIPNPDNLPEVNHINYDTHDNRAENLEWCTRIYNLRHSFLKHSPIRNFCKCKLYYNSKYIDDFQSMSAACRYANEKFGASKSGLMRNLKSKGATIVKI